MTVSLQQPSSAVITKKFSYLLVKTGTLMLKARSDRRGYVPGQVIKMATEIHNKSGKDTGCVLASLIQVDTGQPKIQYNYSCRNNESINRVLFMCTLESDL